MEVLRGLVLLMVLKLMIVGRGDGQLVENFYTAACPNVEAIVKQVVSKNASAIPAIVRLFFHDCFVEGCDASIMIDQKDAERYAEENLSLPQFGYETIIKAKTAVEAECPGIVSCADILAIVTRDVVALAGGPLFSVELGRRDGLISDRSHVPDNIPDPSFDLTQLNAVFARKNLTQIDMIALSGAHTLGVSHCSRFTNRLYPNVAPSLNRSYAEQLKAKCPKKDTNGIVFLDVTTPGAFDNAYYQNLVVGKGLLASDEVLYTDPESKPTVEVFANNAGSFNKAFIAAMRKLGRVGVKTGNLGEIRKNCTVFNVH